MRVKIKTGQAHYFRSSTKVDEALAAKLEEIRNTGRRPSISDIILEALILSPYLFPPTQTKPEGEAK